MSGEKAIVKLTIPKICVSPSVKVVKKEERLSSEDENDFDKKLNDSTTSQLSPSKQQVPVKRAVAVKRTNPTLEQIRKRKNDSPEEKTSADDDNTMDNDVTSSTSNNSPLRKRSATEEVNNESPSTSTTSNKRSKESSQLSPPPKMSSHHPSWSSLVGSPGDELTLNFPASLLNSIDKEGMNHIEMPEEIEEDLISLNEYMEVEDIEESKQEEVRTATPLNKSRRSKKATPGKKNHKKTKKLKTKKVVALVLSGGSDVSSKTRKPNPWKLKPLKNKLNAADDNSNAPELPTALIPGTSVKTKSRGKKKETKTMSIVVQALEHVMVVNGRRMELKLRRLEDDLFDKSDPDFLALKSKRKEVVNPNQINKKSVTPKKNNKKGLKAKQKEVIENEIDDDDNTSEADDDNILLEVCVDNYQSVINAAKGGAKRIELCSSLAEGGLTPTTGLLRMAKRNVQIPIFVMIRPRGGDFVYSSQEIEIMKMDIIHLKEFGADGFVFGVLNKKGLIDESKCKTLLKAADPLPCTFHRAFDLVAHPLSSLNTIINLGFSRILTSGQQPTAMLGIPFIRQLVRSAGSNISIMAGAGVNAENAAQIVKETKVHEIHGSARVKIQSTMQSYTTNVSMGTPGTDDSSHYITNCKIVENIVKNASNI